MDIYIRERKKVFGKLDVVYKYHKRGCILIANGDKFFIPDRELDFIIDNNERALVLKKEYLDKMGVKIKISSPPIPGAEYGFEKGKEYKLYLVRLNKVYATSKKVEFIKKSKDQRVFSYMGDKVSFPVYDLSVEGDTVILNWGVAYNSRTFCELAKSVIPSIVSKEKERDVGKVVKNVKPGKGKASKKKASKKKKEVKEIENVSIFDEEIAEIEDEKIETISDEKIVVKKASKKKEKVNKSVEKEENLIEKASKKKEKVNKSVEKEENLIEKVSNKKDKVVEKKGDKAVTLSGNRKIIFDTMVGMSKECDKVSWGDLKDKLLEENGCTTVNIIGVAKLIVEPASQKKLGIVVTKDRDGFSVISCGDNIVSKTINSKKKNTEWFQDFIDEYVRILKYGNVEDPETVLLVILRSKSVKSKIDSAINNAIKR